MRGIVAAVLLALLVAVFAAGCKGKKEQPNTLASALPLAASIEPPKVYHFSAAGLMLIGVVMLSLGSKTTGGTLFAGGVGMALAGEALTRYPWISLIAVFAVAIIAGALAYECWRLKKGGAAVALAVEKSDVKAEVTNSIKELGADAEELVRHLIDPAKKRLKAEGKL